MKAVPKESRMAIPGILYHYCSNDSLLNIVRNRTFLLTAITAANDYEETRRTRLCLLAEMQKHTDSAERGWLDRLLELYDINDTVPFVGCFSENADQLSQWRGYADNAAGVSIGFNTKCFGLRQHLPLTHASPDQTIGMDKVVYDASVQQSDVAHLMREFVLRTRQNPSGLDDNAIGTAIQLRQLSLIFKNPSFQEEAEWRIVHTPMLAGPPSGPLGLVGSVGKRISRMKGSQIVTSIPLPLNDKDGFEPIARIVVGARNPTDSYDLANLLHEHGFLQVKLAKSTASYR